MSKISLANDFPMKYCFLAEIVWTTTAWKTSLQWNVPAGSDSNGGFMPSLSATLPLLLPRLGFAEFVLSFRCTGPRMVGWCSISRWNSPFKKVAEPRNSWKRRNWEPPAQARGLLYKDKKRDPRDRIKIATNDRYFIIIRSYWSLIKKKGKESCLIPGKISQSLALLVSWLASWESALQLILSFMQWIHGHPWTIQIDHPPSRELQSIHLTRTRTPLYPRLPQVGATRTGTRNHISTNGLKMVAWSQVK